MNAIKQCLILLAVGNALTGCSTIKDLTGQNDNTVLPGQREEVLPPEQQTARDPIVTGEQQQGDDIQSSQQPCDPNDLNCLAPIDQEASGSEAQ